jgi:hypothetical protein
VVNEARVLAAASKVAVIRQQRRRPGLGFLTIRAHTHSQMPVCTENLIRVYDVMESPKLAE